MGGAGSMHGDDKRVHIFIRNLMGLRDVVSTVMSSANGEEFLDWLRDC
jgi:hypothetical protein